MEQLLDAHFSRLEAALNTLIDSITTYNPSPAAAIDLVAADDTLSQGLDQLAQHQSNHACILHLRHTVSVLESQIKTTLRTLAETRKELLETPAGPLADDSDALYATAQRAVPFDELLAYAKRIAKFTLPPSYRPPKLALPYPAKQEDSSTSITDAQRITSGTRAAPAAALAPPAAGSPPSAPSPSQAGPPEIKTEHPSPGPKLTDLANAPAPPPPQQQQQQQQKDSLAWSSLTPEQRAWLDSMLHAPFAPWPSEDTIRRGALGEIQRMLDAGRDPAGEVGGAGVQEGRAGGEEEEAVERERRAMEEREQRRSTGMGPGQERRVETQPVFDGLDLYDPDEE